MPAGQLTLVCERRANFSTVLTWRNEALALVNLTGYTAELRVRAGQNDMGELLATFNVGNSRVTLGGAAATVTIMMTAADTALLTPRPAWYVLELTSGAGTVTRLSEGPFVIKP